MTGRDTVSKAPQSDSNDRGAAEGLSYEQARDELAEVVRRLEAGGTTLEESLALWERGEALAATCQQWLDGVREQLSAAQSPGPGPGKAAGEAADAGDGEPGG